MRVALFKLASKRDARGRAARRVGYGAPAWFRYGVVALATIVLCSCSAAIPARGDELVAESDCPVCESGESAGSTCSMGCAACGECGPVAGPYDEYLCDGGDFGTQAAVRKDLGVDGLEPEDTVAHYDTIHGATYVTPSNKVCIYAPRFAAIREVVDVRAAARYEMVEGAIRRAGPELAKERLVPDVKLVSVEPKIDRGNQPPSLIRDRKQPGEVGREQRPGAAIGSLAPYANLQTIRTGELVGLDIVKIARASLAAITWTGIQAPQVLIDNRQAVAEVNVQSPGTLYTLREPTDSRLRLIKLASKHDALPGEEVEFTLRYDNVGDTVIGNVTIVDHLTTRLAYVDESQKSSLQAGFSTAENEGESLTLRWEIGPPLKPGEGGVIQFKTRVK
jgi:uncharacterized repeat protein (TIGR01451 family)